MTVEADDVGFANVAGERKMGRIKVLLVRMNADLLMGEDLKKTGAGNLFTVFGEPDIELRDTEDGQVVVDLRGVDVYDPTTGEVRSNDTSQIALWMIDTNYNEESFFVRHCYFTGGNDPYSRLKRALKADIDAEAWDSLNRTESRPFDKPETGKIAVKVINDYGDEVMKVFIVGGGVGFASGGGPGPGDSFIDRLRERLDVPYPLAHCRPYVGGRQLIFEAQNEAKLGADFALVAEVSGQYVLTPPSQEFFERVTWEGDIAARWRPDANADSPVIIDPDIRSGRPSVGGISTEILWEQAHAGEDERDLAETYGLTVAQVRSALSYELPLQAA